MENWNERDDETNGEFKTTGSERVKPLHNFALPSLKWGSQRFLRCIKVESSSSDDDHRLHRQISPLAKSGASPSKMMTSVTEQPLHQPSPMIQRQHNRDRDAPSGSAGGEARKKATSLSEEELEDDIERMRRAKRREKQKELMTEEQSNLEAAAAATTRPPWNLRTRKGGSGSGGGGGGSNLRRSDPQKPLGSKGEDKTERPKFSVTLTKKEIEEDFLAMTGHLPPRRPKKRPGIVQRQLESMFPGSWLTEITSESYNIHESTDRKKK